MTVAKFETYVIQPGLGDPIPRIGSGMRIVRAQLGRKWVRIRAPDGRVTRILLSKWLTNVPHVKYYKQEMVEVFYALSNWKRKC